MFIEGISQIKRINLQGRAWLMLDIKHLIAKITEIRSFVNKPSLEGVFEYQMLLINYVNAFYLQVRNH